MNFVDNVEDNDHTAYISQCYGVSLAWEIFRYPTMFLSNLLRSLPRHSLRLQTSLRHANAEQTQNRVIYKTRPQPLLTPAIVLIGCIPVLSFALGTWQLQRLKWKVSLIDELQEKLQLEPLSLPARVK